MSEPAELPYLGGELELFARALNWKRYWSSMLQPYLRGDVLEVGAGLGANTRLLRNSRQQHWVCLEPDAQLVGQLRNMLTDPSVSGPCEVRRGTIANLDPRERFDAILYIDVLEHVEDDRGELRGAAAHLKPGGHLMVLSPAHSWLFSRFDAAIGHHRRYTRKSLIAAAPPDLRLECAFYLDGCGLLASLANRVLLKQNLPTLKQIRFWDAVLVPLSKALDPIFLYRIGKSVVGIWSN